MIIIQSINIHLILGVIYDWCLKISFVYWLTSDEGVDIAV